MIRREQLDVLTQIFEIDRVRFQLQTDISNVSDRTLSYFRNIHRQLKDKLTDTFCRLVAPGLEEQMKNVLEEGNKEESESDQTVMDLKDAYEDCTTSKARLSVLMLVPKTYSKPKVCDLFGCTFYEIREARRICKLFYPNKKEYIQG